jgi:ABC-type amino acid transport substrate-binding protein
MKFRYVLAILLIFMPIVGFSTTVGTTSVALTNEELDWIVKHPVLQVGNEMDWPPFDFAEDGEPKGYSIDLINLIGKKPEIRVHKRVYLVGIA